MKRRSAGNLMILGFLLDRPMSAYEMATLLETQIVGRLVKISAPTVYKNIKTLHRKGYLSAETAKEGEMPEKKIYTVTEAGHEHFLMLMRHFSGNYQDMHFMFNAFLLNIDKLDRTVGQDMLADLRNQLTHARDWMVNHEREGRNRNVFFAGQAIMKQYSMVLNSLVEWIHEVIAEYEERKELGKYSFGPDENVRNHRIS